MIGYRRSIKSLALGVGWVAACSRSPAAHDSAGSIDSSRSAASSGKVRTATAVQDSVGRFVDSVASGILIGPLRVEFPKTTFSGVDSALGAAPVTTVHGEGASKCYKTAGPIPAFVRVISTAGDGTRATDAEIARSDFAETPDSSCISTKLASNDLRLLNGLSLGAPKSTVRRLLGPPSTDSSSVWIFKRTTDSPDATTYSDLRVVFRDDSVALIRVAQIAMR